MIISRNTRRRIERLNPAVQRLYDTDLRFFDSHPDRTFRLRLAGAAEVQQQTLADPHHFPMRAGHRLHVLVRKVAGARIRLYVVGREGMDVDLPEVDLAATWSERSPPRSDLASVMSAFGKGE